MMGGYGRGYGGGYNSVMGGSWFGGMLFLLFGVLILVGIVLLVIWAVRASGGGHGAVGGVTPPPGAAGHDEAVAIAKRRLASGEIDKAQYEELMRTLGG
jgi:putative membrane protein